MENDDSVPLPLRVGIAYNLKKGLPPEAGDMEAEYDSFGTIGAIRNVFESAGIHTELLEADSDFAQKVKSTNVDLVFNLAEGTHGRGREAQVPAILSFLGIPFSGSDETTLAVSLDKALTKRCLSTYGVRTPACLLMTSPEIPSDFPLRFPLIVKPNAEGSSKGISDLAVADDRAQLQKILTKNFRLYHEPMLVEEYIAGREFTVGVLGNGGAKTVFEPMEISARSAGGKHLIYSYQVKKDYQKYISYRCPPDISPAQSAEIKQTAARIYEALECRDFSRIDFRLSEDGTLYFIEINPLPGLAPGDSDYPMLAAFCGVDYRTLVLGVLNSALARYGFRPVAVNRGDLQ